MITSKPPRGESTTARRRALGSWLWVLPLAVGATLLVFAGSALIGYNYRLFVVASVVAPAVAIAYLAWRAPPAWTLSIAVVLSPIAGNWQQLGVSGSLSPDRLLLVCGVGAVLLRAPGVRRLRPLSLEPIHWLLIVLTAYAAASAIAAQTFFTKTGAFGLIEHLGILPFLFFYVAPIAFRTTRDRQILLGALVVLGAYLGLTALFETIGAKALVWPRYINDPNYGIHYGRARGPFVEAVSNGVGLYVCALASVIAAVTWRRVWARCAAVAVVLLCVVGCVFTLQRSVWIAAAAATLVTLALVRELRRYLIPVAAVGAIVIAVTIVSVPGVSAKVHQRSEDQQTVWDRQNLVTAAVNMLKARPLFGFGWATFKTSAIPYFQQNPDYPLSAEGLEVHNVALRYVSELGLIGGTLWALSLLSGVYTGLTARGPPDLRLWRMALLAFAIFYAAVSSFVPPQLFPTLALWMLIGVAWVGHAPAEQLVRARIRRPQPAPAS